MAVALPATAAAEPPSNDDFANAIVLTGLPVSTTGTNVEATSELNEPVHAFVGGGASVWYTWTAPSSGTVTIDLCDDSVDSFDTVRLQR